MIDSLLEFNQENFFKIIRNHIQDPPTLDSLKETIKLNYLYGYLKHLRACYIVAEKNYMDKDYMIDYSTFYARSFPKYERNCLRLHFFSGPRTNEKIINLLNKFNKNELDKIADNYLGFVIIKPLRERFIGKTVLKTYPNEDSRKKIRRYFPRLVNYDVSVNGIPLKQKSVAYQEQDKAVSACATISVWVALHKLKELFGALFLSPAEITLDCGKGFPLLGRILPSEGLNVFQIVSFFNRLNFETEYLDMDMISQILDNNEKLKILLYSYLKFGLPIISGLKLFPVNRQNTSYHAVTILGFNLLAENRAADLIKEKRKNYVFYESDLLEELYIHDDQIGPFSRTSFREENYSIKSQWINFGYEKVLFDDLIIPLYPKIRLSFFTVYLYAEENLKPILIKEAKKYNTWFKISLYLSDINYYKKEILEDNSLNNENKLNILKRNMPKYLWVIKVCGEQNKILDFIFDATDLRQTPSYIFDFQ